MIQLLSHWAFFLTVVFSFNAHGKAVIETKSFDEHDFFSKGYGLSTRGSKVLTEQELQSFLNKLTAELNRTHPEETVTIYVRTAIATEFDSSKDLFVSFGDCYSTEEGLNVSFMKCTEAVKYKHVYIWADPKGFLNELTAAFRVKVPSAKKIVPVVSTEIMKTSLSLAVIKDEDLMNQMRELYPRQQCHLLKKYGYKPSFNDDDKSMITQCLSLDGTN